MGDLSNHFLAELIQFRRKLHQYPEVSNSEVKTVERIKEFVAPFNPDEVLDSVGGNGLLIIFKGEHSGTTTAIRAELDALPISEENTQLKYQSKNKGVAHLCGHDGHVTVVLSTLEYLLNNKPKRGNVMLLFQPAEETGEGAIRMLNDDKLTSILPNEIIGLHNIPKEPLGSVLLSNHHFAAASKGVKLYFTGATAHAAEPQNGKNPIFAIAELVQFIQTFEVNNEISKFSIATIVHATLGEVAFGISPSDGVIMLTLRSFEDNEMIKLEDKITAFAKQVANKYQLAFRKEVTEVFPATINHKKQTHHLKEVVNQLALDFKYIDTPFKWSEDFGHFLSKTEGTFFGLGSGINQPVLHHQSFDFPDELIPIGFSIYKNYLQQNHY